MLPRGFAVPVSLTVPLGVGTMLPTYAASLSVCYKRVYTRDIDPRRSFPTSVPPLSTYVARSRYVYRSRPHLYLCIFHPRENVVDHLFNIAPARLSSPRVSGTRSPTAGHSFSSFLLSSPRVSTCFFLSFFFLLHGPIFFLYFLNASLEKSTISKIKIIIR